MAKEPKRTFVDKLKNHPIVVVVSLVVGAIITAASLMNAVTDIGGTVGGTGVPVAQDDRFEVDEDQVAVLHVLNNDPNAKAENIVLNIVENTQNGELRLLADKSIEYKPAPDFSGSDEFVYTLVGEGGTRSTAIVRLDVTAVNDAPVVSSESIVINYPETLVTIVSLDELVSDADGDTVTLQSYEIAGSLYQPKRSDEIIGILSNIIGELPVEREGWSRNALAFEIDKWVRERAEADMDGGSEFSLTLTVEDAHGNRTSASIPIELRVAKVAGLKGRCESQDGTPSRRTRFAIMQEDEILADKSVRRDRLEDFTIGMIHQDLDADKLEGLDLRTSWSASDNPFKLECKMTALVSGIDLPMLKVMVYARSSVDTSSMILAYDIDRRLEQMERVFGRMYGRAVSFD
jgi:hypothetical protein